MPVKHPKISASSRACIITGQDMAPTTVDAVLDNLSRIHVPIFVFAFVRGLPVTWNLMMPVFVAPSGVGFWCAYDLERATNWTSTPTGHLWDNASFSTGTNDTDQCCHSAAVENSQNKSISVLQPCVSWVYDQSIYGKTVTEEWNMVCGNRWMISSVQSIFLAGLVVGTVVSSHISNWFGRKSTIMVGLLLSIGATALTALSTSVTMYQASRFVMALAISGYSDAIYTLIMETVSPRHRCMPAMTMDNGWTTGMVLLPWLHYLSKEWRATQLYAALPLVPLLVLSWWLMATGRFPAAKQVVTKFAKHGRGPAHLVDEIIEEAERAKTAARDVGRASVADLFSTKVWATRTALLSFQQVVFILVWYHITVSTAGVGGDPYLNFTIGALSEYPVRLVNVVLIKYFHRRHTVCGSMCISAVAMVALWIVPAEFSWVRLGLLTMGRVGTSVSSAVLRVQLSETYPTVVRSVAMGFCNTLGWVGSAVAPFFDDLGHATQPWVPNVVAAVLCAAGAGAPWLLPETFEKTLQDGFDRHGGVAIETTAPNSGAQQVYSVQMTHI
ncbi:organic cation transporter protein-like isoform X2 [Amblyomma americanum]